MWAGVWIAVWRMLLLWAFAFWQGGFFFYTSVVVPRAQDVIGHRQQGFITRLVTADLNASAIAALTFLAVDWLAGRDPRIARRIAMALIWLGMAACQIILIDRHAVMDAMLDPELLDVGDGFYTQHRIYLWVHTIQWGLAVIYLLLQVASWRSRDL